MYNGVSLNKTSTAVVLAVLVAVVPSGAVREDFSGSAHAWRATVLRWYENLMLSHPSKRSIHSVLHFTLIEFYDYEEKKLAIKCERSERGAGGTATHKLAHIIRHIIP